jgi:hypothetical protein
MPQPVPAQPVPQQLAPIQAAAATIRARQKVEKVYDHRLNKRTGQLKYFTKFVNDDTLEYLPASAFTGSSSDTAALTVYTNGIKRIVTTRSRGSDLVVEFNGKPSTTDYAIVPQRSVPAKELERLQQYQPTDSELLQLRRQLYNAIRTALNGSKTGVAIVEGVDCQVARAYFADKGTPVADDQRHSAHGDNQFMRVDGNAINGDMAAVAGVAAWDEVLAHHGMSHSYSISCIQCNNRSLEHEMQHGICCLFNAFNMAIRKGENQYLTKCGR